MPLPPPAPRQALHHRRIDCHGYRRHDGLWDIDAHIVDTKTYGFDNLDRGRIEPGVPLHEMWLRLTVDDALLIHDIVAATEAGPYHICGEAAPAFAALKGVQIKSGFRRVVAEKVGGVKGCTHLVELLPQVATVAIQTISPVREREQATPGAPSRPARLGACYAFRPDGPVVQRRWPEFYTGA
jgi:Protein of unknown function (DUF2889)